MDTTTALNAILAHSRQQGARWAHEQAVEAARAAILAEVPAVEAALPEPSPRPEGGYYDPDVRAHINAEYQRIAPLRALRDAASEVERQCHPGYYTSAETLAAAGLPADVVSRVVAAVAAAPAAAPAWTDAPDVPAEGLAGMVPEGHDPRGAGPIRPAPGWVLHHLSNWPVRACYTIQATYQGVPVARWAPDGTGLRTMAWDEEVARKATERARNRANHDTYLAQLARVREALDTTPALAGTVCAAAGAEAWAAGAHARAELAGVCLALAGWRYCPGQEGGTLTPPWGGVAVTMRGALRLPRGSK